MYKDNAAWMARFEENVEQAKRYVRFCIDVYNHQRKHGRYFLHEHPWLATSWFMPEMTKLMEQENVQRVRTDMCQFGMMSRTGGVGSPLGHVLKPTGFLTNSKHIAKQLSKRCARDHEHVALVGGRAAAAAIYPKRLCGAICKGLADQLREDAGTTIDTPTMDANGLQSLLLLCREATHTQQEQQANSIGDEVMRRVQASRGEAIDIRQPLTTALSEEISQQTTTTTIDPIIARQYNAINPIIARQCKTQVPVAGPFRSDIIAAKEPHNSVLQRACVQTKFDLNVVQMEVEGEDSVVPTGRFRRKRLNDHYAPTGDWPEHWIDTIHEADGHYVDARGDDRGGEKLLSNGMSALYAQNGVEYAVDDVSGAMLDPKWYMRAGQLR